MVGKIVAMLHPESVIVEPQSDQLADEHKHQDIESDREGVVLVSAVHGEVAQGAVPSGCQQHDEQRQAKDKIGDAKPSPNTVIAARFRRIRRIRYCSGYTAHL